MSDHPLSVSRATEDDLEGILSLQAANQVDQGGALSASLPRARVEAMMRDMPLIVARRDGRVTGFLMTTTREMNADLPIVQAMFAAYPGTADAYVYGPICVSAEERGQGLAQRMFEELKTLLPDREGVLFIPIRRCAVAEGASADGDEGSRRLRLRRCGSSDLRLHGLITSQSVV